MSETVLEDVSEKDFCPACGMHHEIVDGQLVAPVICANVLNMAAGLRRWLESGGDEDAEHELLVCLDEVLGEEDEFEAEWQAVEDEDGDEDEDEDEDDGDVYR
jgi:hypothetical protein